MTPAPIGGGQLTSVSGGSQSPPLRYTFRGDAQKPGMEDVGRADLGSAPSPARAGLELIFAGAVHKYGAHRIKEITCA